MKMSAKVGSRGRPMLEEDPEKNSYFTQTYNYSLNVERCSYKNSMLDAVERLMSISFIIKCLLLLCIFVTLFDKCEAFNLSPEAAIIFEETGAAAGGKESYFGFSVGLRSRKKYGDSWLLVGAPRANLTPTPNTPVGLVEPGAVYKCPVGIGSGHCKQLLIDDTGNTVNNLNSGELGYHDLKNHGWLGGAMDTQDSDRESSMVCAPLWKNQLYASTLLVNGACYAQDSELRDATALKRLPLTQFSKQNYQLRNSHTVFHYAHGELGMSVHFPEASDRVLLGAPGVFNWQGTVVELRDAVLSGPGSISRRRRQADVTSPQQTYSIQFVPNPFFTSSISDADYFGYSVSSGRFLKDLVHYVAGAPRGANSRGKVLVFLLPHSEESELLVLVERSGTQVGEYFGASVVAADVNGDGRADLVVGAPLYSTSGGPDQGAVYFFGNIGGGQVLELEGLRLEGSRFPGGRFGSVVSSPGDLNGDGYNDVVVGAPYEGPGAVYVYLGSRNGLVQQFSQRISAKDLTSGGRPLSGFGISISRGIDVDDNQYPDIAVGSYVSGHAVLLRTRPVAILEGMATTTPMRLSIYDTAFTTTACVAYMGTGVPQQQDVTVLVTLDYQRQLIAPRAIFTDNNAAQYTYNVTIQRDGRQCRQLKVKVQSERNNAQDPVGIRLQYWLADSSLRDSEIHRKPARQFLSSDAPSPPLGPITSPVTDPSDRAGRAIAISFVTGCEEDEDPSCRSDLRVKAAFQSFSGARLIVGKQNRIKMTVEVENHGEPAFLPNVTMAVRRPLDLLLPITHTCERLGTHNPSIVCRLENPLLQGRKEQLEVEVDVEQLTDRSGPVQVVVTVGSNDVEVTPLDNTRALALQLEADVLLQLHGSSIDEQVMYERQAPTVLNTTSTKTLTFTHKYSIMKKGPTPVGEVALTVEIPVKDAHNNTLLTIYAPERELMGVAYPCRLEGAVWVTVKSGFSVNLTDAGDSSIGRAFSAPAGRHRRQTAHESTDEVPVPVVSCRDLPGLQCAVMHCSIGSWPQGSASASLSYRLDLNLTTLASIISVKDGTTLVSAASATIVSLAPTLYYKGNRTTYGSARTTVLPGRLPGEGISWWWYLLAVVLGLLLLVAMVYGLYKMGFFRRKVKEEMDAMTANLVAEKENQ